MSVYEKLMKVQAGLKAPKSQYNKFGNYYYRNCEDIQEAAKPLMKDVGAALIVGDDLVQISDRFYIRATARFIDCETGELVENTAYAREDLEKKGMDVSQVTGSTSSYARKYALNGLFCIDDVKDADNQDNTGSEKGKKTEGQNDAKQGRDTPAGKSGMKPAKASDGEADIDAEKVSAAKIDKPKLIVIQKELVRTGLEADVLFNMFKVGRLEDLTNGQFQTIMKKFQVTPSKEA